MEKNIFQEKYGFKNYPCTGNSIISPIKIWRKYESSPCVLDMR